MLDSHPDHDQATAGLKTSRKAADKESRENVDVSNLAPVAPSEESGGMSKKLFGKK